MQKNPNYYDLLKVTHDAPAAVIHAACKALIQLNHPDNFKGREEEAVAIANKLREACDILINPTTRQEYDRWLEKETRPKAFWRMEHQAA